MQGPLQLDPMRVAREGFDLELDPRTGALRLLPHAGPPLTLDPPRAGALRPAGPALRARGRVKGACGPAERLELQWSPPGGSGLRLVVEVPEDGSGLAVELFEEPRGAAVARPGPRVPVALALSAEAFAATRLPLGDGRDGGDALLLAAPRHGAGPHLLLGWTGGPRRGELALEEEEGTLRLRAVDGGPAAAPPGPVATPRAWLGLGASQGALLASWAVRTGAELGARAPGRGGVTWPGAQPSRSLDGLRPVRVHTIDASAPPQPEEPAGAGAEGRWRVAYSGTWRGLVGRTDAVRVADPWRHAFASRRLWLNAVGPLDPGAEDAVAFETASVLAGLAAGLVELAVPPDDPTVTDARAALLQRTLPPLAREADLVGDALCVRLLGARRAVLQVNRAAAPRALGLDLEAVGLAPGPWHVFDFLAGEDLGLRAERVPPRPVPAGGCRLLGLTPAADRPQVVGSTLHVGMGTLEVAALRPSEGDGALELVLRHAGTHRGAVWVAVPGEAASRRVEVAFRDEAVASVPAPRRGDPALLP